MIIQTNENGVIHTYSDHGLPIRQKDTGLVFENGYERVGDKLHEWEEVEDDE